MQEVGAAGESFRQLGQLARIYDQGRDAGPGRGPEQCGGSYLEDCGDG